MTKKGQTYVVRLRKALRLIADYRFTQEEYQMIAREALKYSNKKPSKMGYKHR